jgi:hypothetical protein
MRHPTRDDFSVQKVGSAVEVVFLPSDSHLRFGLLDPSEHAKHGPLSEPYLRHAGPTGDFGSYDPFDVTRLAYTLACEAVRG